MSSFHLLPIRDTQVSTGQAGRSLLLGSSSLRYTVQPISSSLIAYHLFIHGYF